MIPNEERKYDPDVPSLAPSHALHSVSKELASILVDTGWAIRAVEAYKPIVPRRGRPNDLSRELSEYFRFFNDDDGTVFSWFTAAELISFGLNSRVMTRQAYVPKGAAHLFRNCPFGFPLEHWPRDTPVTIASWSRDGSEVTWRESYETIIEEFVAVVPRALAMAGPPGDTRLVVMANW
jgi:hypothetical protein